MTHIFSNVRKPDYLQSLQCGRVVIVSGLEVLRFHDLNAFLGFDAFEDDVCVHPLCDGGIATCLVVGIEPVRVDGFPKGIIIEAFEPFLKVLLIFKLLHVFSMSHLAFGPEEKPINPSTEWRGC